jgi:hypothetical protein
MQNGNFATKISHLSSTTHKCIIKKKISINKRESLTWKSNSTTIMKRIPEKERRRKKLEKLYKQINPSWKTDRPK